MGHVGIIEGPKAYSTATKYSLEKVKILKNDFDMYIKCSYVCPDLI